MSQKILVVDDEPDIRKVVIFRLKKAGYEVTHADNGQEALEIIRQGQPFDLVLLDLVMPLMDGYELCRILKSDERTKQIPVIILSASTMHNVVAKTGSLKADDYISKPFDPEVLLSKVKNVLVKSV